MYKLHSTKSYIDNVTSIHSHIKKVLDAPMAADSLIDSLSEKLWQIKKMPYSIALVKDDYLASLGIRYAIIKNYILIYTIYEEKKIVKLVRFLDGRSDWINILKEFLTYEE